MSEQKTFRVPNIGCDGCIRTIVSELSEQPGIHRVEGDVNTKMVTVAWDLPATWEYISQTLTEIDYPPEKVMMP